MTISNASDGSTAFSTTPIRPSADVMMMPPYGTWCLFMRAANFGPEPATASERRVRPVEYSPAFRDDSAAVSTTTWITSPACGMPMPEKNVTNGDSLEE